ncbi:MAG: hypothetical protein ACRDRL_32320 [Sciscionella sp.]
MGIVEAGHGVVTNLRYDGGRIDFGVCTDRPLLQDRLVKMGWRSVGPSAFSRRLANGPDVERIADGAGAATRGRSVR